MCIRDRYSTNVAVYNVRQVPSIFLINRNNELKLRGEGASVGRYSIPLGKDTTCQVLSSNSFASAPTTLPL